MAAMMERNPVERERAESEVLYHFPRVWAGRNDDGEHVFANGHVYGRAERRESVRLLVSMLRRIRA